MRRYTLNYTDQIGKLDDKVTDKGVTVVIEPKVRACMHACAVAVRYCVAACASV